MALNEPRPGLRLINGSKQVAKLDVRLLPGEEITVPDGATLEPERHGVRPAAPAPAPAPAPSKKAAAKAALKGKS